MRVTRIATLGLRNLADGEVVLGDGITVLWGANGAGKTNVLEALYLGLAGRSPRTKSDREAIAFGAPLGRSEVTVADVGPPPRSRTFLCAIERAGERRHQVDGRPVDAAAQAELRPAISVFMPDRLVLVKGPPAARRAHLDRFCAALWPARAEARRRYGRALAQRNALLGRARSGGPQGSLDAWDTELAAAGAELMAVRAEATGRLAEPFADAAAELELGAPCELAYRPRSDAGSADALAAELAGRRGADIERGFTTHGPHLDELALRRDGRALRRYGSQGQQRLGLLALLFAERAVLVADGRQPPLMLLDDVTSELDERRRSLLCERLLAGGGQALITATETAQLPAGCPREELALREGRVIAEAPGDTAGAGAA